MELVKITRYLQLLSYTKLKDSLLQGQLGLGDIKFKHKFTLFPKHFKSKIIDVAAGYQHSIIITGKGDV